MLVPTLVLTFVFALFFQGFLFENANSQTVYKRPDEDNHQLIFNENSQNAAKEQTDVLTLPLDDVFRPGDQNIAELFHVNELLPSSIPLPVQLLLIGDYEQNKLDSKLNISQNNIPPHVGKYIVGATPISKKLAPKQKPTKANVKKNINDGDNNRAITRKPNQRKTDVNKKRYRICSMENSIKNQDVGKKINNSTERLYNDEDINRAVEYLLRILKNPHNLKELDSTNASNAETHEKLNMDIDRKEVHSFNSGIDQKRNESDNKNDINDENLNNTISTPSETVSQLLREQNNLLKEVLFKTLDRGSNSDESNVKKIHLILDIDNLVPKTYDIPINLETEGNSTGTVLEIVNSKYKNDADENINCRIQPPMKIPNDDYNTRFQQYPQNHIFNCTGNSLYPYFINPFNVSSYYNYKPCTNIHPIAMNKAGVVPEDGQEMLIYEPKYLNKGQTDDAKFNNYYKYNNYVKISPTIQSGGICYYRKPNLDVSKCPFHGLYYRRQ